VVPSGVSLRGPDMSFDMRLLTVWDDTTGSDGSRSMDVGLSDPLGWNWATGPAKAAAYVTAPSGGKGCRLQIAAYSPVIAEVAGRGVDPGAGAGRLLAGSDESPVLASSLALFLSASWLDECRGTLAPPAGASGFFYLRYSAILNSLRTAGKS